MREPISPEERLSLTLRFLASGQSFEDLKFLTAIAPQTIAIIVMETCEAIISVLKDNIKVSKIIKCIYFTKLLFSYMYIYIETRYILCIILKAVNHFLDTPILYFSDIFI